MQDKTCKSKQHFWKLALNYHKFQIKGAREPRWVHLCDQIDLILSLVTNKELRHPTQRVMSFICDTGLLRRSGPLRGDTSSQYFNNRLAFLLVSQLHSCKIRNKLTLKKCIIRILRGQLSSKADQPQGLPSIVAESPNKDLNLLPAAKKCIINEHCPTDAWD